MKKAILFFISLGISLLIPEMILRCLYFGRSAPEQTAIMHYISRVERKTSLLFARFLGDNAVYGPELNRRAWIASFVERGMRSPEGGPREGYGGDKLGPKLQCPGMRYIERTLNIPGLVAIDSDGFQVAGPADASIKILIIGGSVAFGAYASELSKTYFSRLSEILSLHGIKARIYVLAAGGWTSHDELSAFVQKGLDKKPNAVIFLDGLNDLTVLDDNFQQRVAEYLSNMKKSKEVAVASKMQVIFALQPFLPFKQTRSSLEERIMEVSRDSYMLGAWYKKISAGLRIICDKNAHFVDCSTTLSGEKETTFSDLWHFSDPGHFLLAEQLARDLEKILKEN